MNPVLTNEPRAWTARRWWTMAGLIFLLHVGLVFALGAKKARPMRPVAQVPFLRQADPGDEFIALNDPTLFALPHANDFIAANWTRLPVVSQPSFRWTEPPRWLPLAVEPLGRAFGQFMQTNQFAGWTLDFKPEPKFSDPAPPPMPVLLPQSSLHLRGELLRRQLLTALRLPNWPDVDVIAPSKVQVVVDAVGRVCSAILLPPDANFESATRNAGADQKALELATAARFAPGPGLTVGQMIFYWHTVPVPATNAPVRPP